MVIKSEVLHYKGKYKKSGKTSTGVKGKKEKGEKGSNALHAYGLHRENRGVRETKTPVEWGVGRKTASPREARAQNEFMVVTETPGGRDGRFLLLHISGIKS